MSQNGRHIVCSTCGAVNRVALGRPLSAGKCGKCGAALSVAEPMDVTGEVLDKLISRDEGAFVLDVWAPWCGPCRAMAPAYAQASSQLHEQARFFKLNSDVHKQAAGKLGVRGIPALFIFSNGRVVAEHAGALPSSDIIGWVQNSLSTA